MNLRALDDRLLPGLTRRAQQFASRFDRFRPAPAVVIELRFPEPPVAPRAEPTVDSPAAPSEPGPSVVDRLRGADERFAGGGALGLVREVPQVGFFAIALVLAVGGATVLQRESTRPQTADPSVTIAQRDRIGPEIGTPVSAYLVTRRQELAQRAKASPDERAYAVLSFDTYQKPRDLRALMARVDPVAVFLQVPIPKEQTPVLALPVRNYDVDVFYQYRQQYAFLVADAQEKLSTALTSPPDFKREYERDSRLEYRQAAELQKECACIFAAVVRGPLKILRDLALVPGVRLVDLAPPEASYPDLDDPEKIEEALGLTFRGLLPSERVTVTGGNEAVAGG